MTTEGNALVARSTEAIEGVALDLGVPREGPAATDSCLLLVQDTTTVILEKGLDQGPEKDTMGESIEFSIT